MGRESRVRKIDPQFSKTLAEKLTIINACLARTQLALILHRQDGQPVGEAAREHLDLAVDALLKLQQLFHNQGSRS